MKKKQKHSDLMVIDNFLPEDDFNKLIGIINSDNFGWFKADGISDTDSTMNTTLNYLDNYYFVHMVYVNYRITSTYFDNIMEIVDDRLKKRLGGNYNMLHRIKVNMYPRTHEVQVHPWHQDSQEIPHLGGALLMLNTCDGYTGFADGTEVDSVANRMVIFDSTEKHFSTSCSNTQTRMTMNFNYL